MTTTNELRWDPPGPGPWEAETAHFGRPFPRYAREAFVRGFKRGFAASTARFGLLLSHFEIEFVNDFWYQQPAAFGAPKGAKGPPPAPILWLLTRLHPGIRARIKTGAAALESRQWRADLSHWDDVDKPAALAKHRELLAVDVPVLDDAALIAHLGRTEKHMEDMVYLHHHYTITCTMPVGLLLSDVAGWTGVPAGQILEMLRGSTPVSLGFSAAELSALVQALKDDAASTAVLRSTSDAATKVEALRNANGAVGETARAFFDLVWHRAVSYDLADKTCGEMPEVLLSAIAAATQGGTDMKANESAEKRKKLRELVPEAHRADFDALVEEARVINRLRDERGLYADCWAVGIGRRALLEAGKRLVAKGKIRAADQAVDLSLSEIESLLGGASKPTASDVDARTTWRTTADLANIPPFLGGQPSGPPPFALLPLAAQRPARAVDAVLSNLFLGTDKTSSETVVHGLSVNAGTYEGTARVVSEAAEFSRIQKGDVLVARNTAPYFNVILPMLGAIVTDRGGQLSHAAIVAREFGIPGVVGTKEATKLIPDGARVIVDGTKGEIRVLKKPG